jgi:CO dehydrogenase/acetyl-CoA synthase delta subunit
MNYNILIDTTGKFYENKKLLDIAFYNIFKYKKITKKAEKFNKPVIEFYNIDIKDDKKKNKKLSFF